MDQRTTKNEYTYEKVLICLYPHVGWLVKQMRQSVINRAVLSHRSEVDPERLTEALLQEEYYCSALEEGMRIVGEALLSLNELEAALVEYRCWNKSEALKACLKKGLVYSKKTLLRKYYAGIRKAAKVLHERGIDLRWFEEIVLHYEWGRRVYRKVSSAKFNKRKIARAGKSPFGKGCAEKERFIG